MHGYRHGGHGTRLYRIWAGMKARCNIPSASGYASYGGRGITICEEWQKDFGVFRTWAYAHGYNDELTLDRIDTNGNYEPSNCRWVDMKVQANNTRRNRVITKGEKKQTLTQWSEITGIGIGTIQNRIVNLGWSEEKAVTTPVRIIERNKKYKAFGQEKTIRQWAKDLGINYSTLWYRIVRNGWDIERALQSPTK